MKRFAVLAAVIAFMVGDAEGAVKKKPVPAPQAVKCADAKTVLGALQQKYGETVVFYGLTSPTMALVIISNADTRTWTAITVNVNGLACLIGEGEDAAVTIPGRRA